MVSPNCAVPHTDRDQPDHTGASCLSVFWNLCFLRCFTCYLTMAAWRGIQAQHLPLRPILTVAPSLLQLSQRLWATRAGFTLLHTPQKPAATGEGTHPFPCYLFSQGCLPLLSPEYRGIFQIERNLGHISQACNMFLNRCETSILQTGH